jgi:carbonic anhydrase/acetyltransferase-like protein (isoleucine patch superfamily)
VLLTIDLPARARHLFRMNLEDQLHRHLARKPQIHPTAFVAPGAAVVGDVTLGENASVWYHTVLRGDINSIVIGPNSNIQDGTVVHLADDYGVAVGAFVTCGHQAVLHACAIGDECLIGMGAIILDGAEIGARSIIGANALVTKDTKVPPGSLVVGSPGKIVRQLSLDEQRSLKPWAEKYVALSRHYLSGKFV